MNSTMLIVDDAPEVHKLVRFHLDGEGIDIHSAFNGEQGILEAATLRPSLILLDVDMPGMDGFEVCRNLKSKPPTHALPIIFLTADSSQHSHIRGLNLGAADYMNTAFKPAEWRARARAALRLKSEIEKLAMVDGMTGLWNKTYMDLHLASHLSHSRRTNRPLACAVADIDNLKHINRNHGRTVGDRVLRAVGHILASQGRLEDTTGYLVNGKFIKLLPGIDGAGAGSLADRARVEIEKQLLEVDGVRVNATCSFGIADTHSGSESSLLDRADAALLSAKHAGRNRVSAIETKSRKINVRAAA